MKYFVFPGSVIIIFLALSGCAGTNRDYLTVIINFIEKYAGVSSIVSLAISLVAIILTLPGFFESVFGTNFRPEIKTRSFRSRVKLKIAFCKDFWCFVLLGKIANQFIYIIIEEDLKFYLNGLYKSWESRNFDTLFAQLTEKFESPEGERELLLNYYFDKVAKYYSDTYNATSTLGALRICTVNQIRILDFSNAWPVYLRPIYRFVKYKKFLANQKRESRKSRKKGKRDPLFESIVKIINDDFKEKIGIAEMQRDGKIIPNYKRPVNPDIGNDYTKFKRRLVTFCVYSMIAIIL